MGKKYLLLKRAYKSGFKDVYAIVMESEDFAEIEEYIKQRVFGGAPVCDFRIVSEVEFEFKCAIELKENDDG